MQFLLDKDEPVATIDTEMVSIFILINKPINTVEYGNGHLFLKHKKYKRDISNARFNGFI